MNAGRDLDALVAEKVMGLTVRKSDTPEIWDYEYSDDTDGWFLLPEYSTDIAAAWQVVEKMNSLRKWPAVNNFAVVHNFSNWKAGFLDLPEFEGITWDFEAEAPTAPHAICLAALKAVDVSK